MNHANNLPVPAFAEHNLLHKVIISSYSLSRSRFLLVFLLLFPYISLANWTKYSCTNDYSDHVDLAIDVKRPAMQLTKHFLGFTYTTTAHLDEPQPDDQHSFSRKVIVENNRISIENLFFSWAAYQWSFDMGSLRLKTEDNWLDCIKTD